MAKTRVGGTIIYIPITERRGRAGLTPQGEVDFYLDNDGWTPTLSAEFMTGRGKAELSLFADPDPGFPTDITIGMSVLYQGEADPVDIKETKTFQGDFKGANTYYKQALAEFRKITGYKEKFQYDLEAFSKRYGRR